MSTTRDYNHELKDTADHKYAYNFDFDVMHPFMLKSFLPFFCEGNMLELGSFKGDFTKRFLPHFSNITCVEASDEAIELAKQTLGPEVNFVHGLFEEISLPTKYDHIIMTHVLEHIEHPVAVRFGWNEASHANLYNKDGLPALPFRTDNPLIQKFQ